MITITSRAEVDKILIIIKYIQYLRDQPLKYESGIHFIHLKIDSGTYYLK